MRVRSLFVVLVLSCASSCRESARVKSTDAGAGPVLPTESDAQVPQSDAAAPQVPELKDAGHPDAGESVVSKPNSASGETCAQAILLTHAQQSAVGRPLYTVSGDTRLGTPKIAHADCASAGKELHYKLDLSTRKAQTPVRIRVNADFDASLSVSSGECDDLHLAGCSEDHTEWIQNPFLAQDLEPGVYTITVDGENKEDAGEFELSVELLDGTVNCSSRPSNNTCSGAIALDPMLSHQLVFGSTSCATDDAFHSSYCQNIVYYPKDVFYGLDLTARANPVLLHANTDLPGTNFDTAILVLNQAAGSCFESIACNDELRDIGGMSGADMWVKLTPGYYYIAVDGYDEGSGDFALSVDLSECVDSNDTCAEAVEMDPSPGQKYYEVNLGCMDGARRFSESDGVTRDAFYRLDLSEYADRAHLRANLQAPTSARLALLEAAGQTCGYEMYVGDSIDLFLDSAVYYLGVFADDAYLGPEVLDVELAAVSTRGTASCIEETLSDCVEERQSDCCEGLPSCLLSYQRCGLEPAVLDCVCQAQPECCTPPLTYGADCTEALTVCNVFCPTFDAVTYCGQQ